MFEKNVFKSQTILEIHRIFKSHTILSEIEKEKSNKFGVYVSFNDQ